jgi:asparagine N-glycosylation enzyme membrane subunit Stt3
MNAPAAARARGRAAGAAAALIAAGLAVRLSDWAAVFRGGRVLFVDTDDYYHLRRIMAAAAAFPRLPAVDAYLGFPAGFAVNWPALYDRFVGGLTLLAGLGRPDLRVSQLVAAAVPPLAGAATLWLFWRAARRLLGEAAALWSLAFAAVLPPLVFYTALGRPDHHCFENLWFLVCLLALLRLLDARTEKARALSAAALAAAGAVGALFWIGQIGLAATGFLFALAELARPRRDAAPERALFWLGAAFLVEAVLLLPSGFSGPWAGEALFDAPSLFQPLALAAAGLWIWALVWRRAEGWRPGRAAAAAGLAFAATAALAARGVASLARYAAAPLPVFRTFTEMQPLLAPFGRWGLGTVLANFGWAFFLLPPLAVLFARAERRPAARLLLAWAGTTGALALWQTRYALHFALPAALLWGWACARAAAAVSERFSARRLPLPRAAAAVLLAAGAAVLLAPALENCAGLALAPADAVTGNPDLLAACDWLRENTPPTRSLWSDEGAPEYGVYALHSFGDQIAAVAQRPAAAGNMHFLPDAIMNSIRFFFEDDPSSAYAFLRGKRFRYVLLTDLLHDGTLPMYADLFGLNGFEAVPTPDGGLRVSPRYWSLVYPRLYALDGAAQAGGAVASVEHFRLVYESPTQAHGVHSVKVYEVVEGARVEGACRAGRVEASVSVLTNEGRSFVYRDAAACGPDRRFRLALPYVGTYSLASGRRRFTVSVAERDALDGLPVRPKPVDGRR